MMASEANATEVVRWLLDRGVDPTLNDNQGYSALDYAIAGQHVEVERLLRERIGVSASSAQMF
jgi:ankyrin repeat protein